MGRSGFAAALSLLLAVGACGEGAPDAEAISFEEYFASFSYDFDPAANRAELARRSEIVVDATLVDVVDGPVFGDGPDDPAASRFAVFVFDSERTDEPIHVRLPRPNTSDIASIRAAMPLGGSAVLYLVRVPEIPARERDLWHAIDGAHAHWEPTTPQGFILERTDVDAEISLPIDGSEISDAPPPGSDIDAWLPSFQE